MANRLKIDFKRITNWLGFWYPYLDLHFYLCVAFFWFLDTLLSQKFSFALFPDWTKREGNIKFSLRNLVIVIETHISQRSVHIRGCSSLVLYLPLDRGEAHFQGEEYLHITLTTYHYVIGSIQKLLTTIDMEDNHNHGRSFVFSGGSPLYCICHCTGYKKIYREG